MCLEKLGFVAPLALRGGHKHFNRTVGREVGQEQRESRYSQSAAWPRSDLLFYLFFN